MVGSKMALLMRGPAAGAIVALSAMLTGCVVDTADAGDGEDIAETASDLDLVIHPGGGGVPEEITGEPQQDPDPVPWRPHVRGQDDPNPDPDHVPQSIPTPGGAGSNDNK
jgi:predicted small secreted protein